MNKDIKNLVKARVECTPSNMIIRGKPFTREQLVEEIEKETEIGKHIVKVHMLYLRSLKYIVKVHIVYLDREW